MSTMFEDEPSAGRRNPNNRFRRNILISLVVVAIAASILVADLLARDVPTSNLESLEIDLRNRAPVATADLEFRYNSKLSKVEPSGMTCHLDSGDLVFGVEKTARHSYKVEATCPDEDVEDHADLVWELLTRRGNSLEEVLASGICEVEVKIRLGYMIPFKHSVEMALPELLAMGEESQSKSKSSNKNKNSSETEEDGEDETSKPASTTPTICHVDKQTLGICLPLHLPNASSLPSELIIKTPALEALAQPTYTEGMSLSVDAWEGSFRPSDNIKNRIQNAPALISLSSQDDRLPFYRPVLDLFLAPVDSSDIRVTLDGHMSFLEVLLGRHHEFRLDHFQKTSEELREDRRRLKEHRQLTPVYDDVTNPYPGSEADNESSESSSTEAKSLADTYIEDYDAAAADCIGVGDTTSDAFGFGLCWLLDFPRQQVTVVGNMTLFDTNMLMVTEISWTDNYPVVRVDVEAEALMVGENELVDVTGMVLWDESDDDNIKLDTRFENTGGFWPFLVNLETSWPYDDDFDLVMKVEDFTFTRTNSDNNNWKDIVGAIGSMALQGIWTSDFSMQFRMDHPGTSDVLEAVVGTSETRTPMEEARTRKLKLGGATARRHRWLSSLVEERITAAGPLAAGVADRVGRALFGRRKSRPASRIAGATADRRRLFLEMIAGYEPLSQVTDHNAIDLDQEAMEQQLSLANEDGFEQAFRIYTEGAHSLMVAKVFLAAPLPMDLERGTPITGVDAEGNQVAGTAYEDTAAGATSIIIRYKTSDSQQNYVTCRVGASVWPITDGCLVASGTLSIDGETDIPYTYDPLVDNIAKRTIQGFSTSARKEMYECANCPYWVYQQYYNYYGEHDYANQIVLAAFNNEKTNFMNFNNDFGLYGYTGKEQIIKITTAYMAIWMYVIRQLEEALDDCKEACTIENCNDDPVAAWDQAAAYYVGSLEGPDGSGSGKLAYALADKRCANFKTCGPTGDALSGTSRVNFEITNKLRIGQAKVAKGECSSARIEAQQIQRLMLIPFIQGTLRYAFKTDFEPYSEKSEAEGVAFALAVVPAIANCDFEAANIIASNMQAGQSGTADFALVKAAFERTYDCLGIDGSEIGGLYDVGAGDYFDGAQPGDDWNNDDDGWWEVADDDFWRDDYYQYELNLEMTSVLSWGDEEYWDAEMVGKISYNDKDASLAMNGRANEGISDRNLELDISFEDYEEEWDETKDEDTQRQNLEMSLTKDREEFMSMALELQYTDQIKASLNSRSEWSGDKLWDLDTGLVFRWDTFESTDDFGDVISVDMQLAESTFDLDLEVAGALTLQYGNDGTDTTTFMTEIAHDSSDKATMQLQWITGQDNGDFTIEAESECVWDGEDRWKSDATITVSPNDDGGDLTARATDSVHDFTMDADFNLSLEEDDDVFSVAITGSSDAVLDGEEFFNVDLSFTSNGYASDATGTVVAIRIGEKVSDFDMGSDLVIDGNDGLALQLSRLNIQLKEDTYLDGTGSFTVTDYIVSAKSNMLMPVVTHQLDVDILNDVTDYFILQSNIHYWSEDENYLDNTFRIVQQEDYDSDDKESSSFEVSCIDQGNLDYAMNFTGALLDIYDDDNETYHTNLERLFLYSKETTFVDMSASFIDSYDYSDKEWGWELLSDTTEESDLQMDMKMSFGFLDSDGETLLRMVMDHMVCGWRETSFLEMPMRLMTIAPVVPIGDSELEPEIMKLEGISTRLEGMPALTDETRLAFEKATEEFYNELYQSSSVGRRLSSEFSFLSFRTDVKVTGDEPDENGNTITYDQTIEFVSSESSDSDASDTYAREILAQPLEVDGMKEKYLEKLVSSDADFSQVSEVSAPVVPLPENDKNTGRRSKRLSSRAVAGIVFASIILCCFCSCFGIYFFLRQQQKRAVKSFADDFHAANPPEPEIVEPTIEETPVENNKDESEGSGADSSYKDEPSESSESEGSGADSSYNDEPSESSEEDEEKSTSGDESGARSAKSVV